jgi:hypothetical protein
MSQDFFEKQIQSLYEIKEIKCDFYNSGLYAFLDKHFLDEIDITKVQREYLKKYISENKDNLFWSSYFQGCLSEGEIKKSKLQEYYRISADLGNPFAMYRYAELLGDNKKEKILEYCKKSADLGYYKSVLGMIITMSNNKFNKFSNNVYDTMEKEAVEEFVNKILPYVPLLEKAESKEGGYDETISEYLIHIYDVLNNSDFQSQDGIPYCYKSLRLRVHSGNVDNGDYRDIIDNMIKDCKKLKKMEKDMKQLVKVRNMSFDEICNSIVREYMV